MADQPHDVCDLLSGHKATRMALPNEVRVEIVFLRGQNSSLVQTYCRSMNIHMNEDDIHISSTAR